MADIVTRLRSMGTTLGRQAADLILECSDKLAGKESELSKLQEQHKIVVEERDRLLKGVELTLYALTGESELPAAMKHITAEVTIDVLATNLKHNYDILAAAVAEPAVYEVEE